MDALTGGCACASVRFRLLSQPYDAGWCHCRTCQLNSGSPAMVFATVPLADYMIEQGEALIARFDSSDSGHRLFCKRCGTPLAMHDHAFPDRIDFTMATLDTPAQVTPGFHIFYASRIAWADACDDLPRHPQFRHTPDPESTR